MRATETTTSRAQLDATTYAGKEMLLRTLRAEAEEFLNLAGVGDHWESPTASGHWQVRDLVGHLVDVTEGYLEGFDIARSGGEAPEPLGLRIMAQRLDERATAFRSVSQPDLMQRLRADFDKMMAVFDGLGPDDWAGLMAPHTYMGPVPAFIFVVFHLVDYSVHGWDMREGLGLPNGLSGDVSDILAPFMFVLWQATAETERVEADPVRLAIRVSGRNGGAWLVNVTGDGYSCEQADPAEIDVPAILEFDPASLILTAYGRINAGTAYGDRQTIDRYRSLFFAI
jgi:uncharacterized protein (TIGR03083 family)